MHPHSLLNGLEQYYVWFMYRVDQLIMYIYLLFDRERRYPENPAIWLARERAVFSYLLTMVMVTNYMKCRVKLRIERAKFQFVLIIFCNRVLSVIVQLSRKKQWILTKAITVMSFTDTLMRQCVNKNTTFPVLLSSFFYLLKIEFRNK